MKISQDEIDELATSVGLLPSAIEEGINHNKTVYLERDIEGTSLYAMALMSVPVESGQIKVFCGLYNAQRKVASDGEVYYQDLDQAVKAVDSRFNALRSPFQPVVRRLAKRRKIN